MNDMEAAREAARRKVITGIEPPQTQPDADYGFGFTEGYNRGFADGYNAAQPKPCVWTWDADLAFWTTGCSRVPVRHYGEYCHMCGGKIEEATQ